MTTARPSSGLSAGLGYRNPSQSSDRFFSQTSFPTIPSMFGFLRHCRNDSDYQRAYRRCCQFQHIEYGVPSLAFLSYESVFLYQLGIDSGLVATHEVIETKTIANRKCCRLQASRRMLNDADSWLARFATSFGVLLGKIKIDDDIRDSGSIAAKLTGTLLKRKHSKAISYFSSLDNQFPDRVNEFVDEHHKLENKSFQNSMKRFAEPTGRAFGYLFGLMGKAAKQNHVNSDKFDVVAEAIGKYVGESIIAYDCAIDFEKDKKSGEYNPLHSLEDVKDSLRYCANKLHAAGELLAKSLGDGLGTLLPTQRVLLGRSRALQTRFAFLGDCFAPKARDGIATPPGKDDSKESATSCLWDCSGEGCGQCCSELACSPLRLQLDSLECCNGGGDAAGSCCDGADCCSGCDCSC